MQELSPQMARLLVRLREQPQLDSWSTYDGPRFSTNAITSRAGSFYEKLRYAVDYQEENAIRRAAIERILKRLIVFEHSTNLSRELLTDLVRAGYIKNETLPEAVADDVQGIIERYLVLVRLAGGDPPLLWSLAACEIEQHLFPPTEGEAVLDVMYNAALTYVRPKHEGVVDETFFKLEVYIACRRLFLRDTPEEIHFALVRAMLPAWSTVSASDAETLRTLAAALPETLAHIEELLASPLHFKIEAHLKNESIYFTLLREIVRQYGVNAQEVLADEARLTQKVRSILFEFYRKNREKLSRAGTRAVVYILITKVIIGLAIELPYELIVLGEVHYLPLAINAFFFPLLLLFMVKTVTFPGEENTKEVVRGMQSLVAGRPPAVVYVPVAERSFSAKVGFALFYLLLATLSFGAVIWLLTILNFNLASMGLFLFFLTVVSYFGLRIRYKARDWTLERGEESAAGLVWYLLSLPVVRTGRWLATRMSSINIFVIFMDVILETPFKLLLGSFDAFISFAKETKRESV